MTVSKPVHVSPLWSTCLGLNIDSFLTTILKSWFGAPHNLLSKSGERWKYGVPEIQKLGVGRNFSHCAPPQFLNRIAQIYSLASLYCQQYRSAKGYIACNDKLVSLKLMMVRLGQGEAGTVAVSRWQLIVFKPCKCFNGNNWQNLFSTYTRCVACKTKFWNQLCCLIWGTQI